MNRTCRAGLAAAGLCFVLVGSSVATDLRWLNYSPVRFFTDQDWDLAVAAGRRALGKAAAAGLRAQPLSHPGG